MSLADKNRERERLKEERERLLPEETRAANKRHELEEFVAARLAHGKSTFRVQEELLAKGVSPDAATALVREIATRKGTFRGKGAFLLLVFMAGAIALTALARYLGVVAERGRRDGLAPSESLQQAVTPVVGQLRVVQVGLAVAAAVVAVLLALRLWCSWNQRCRETK